MLVLFASKEGQALLRRHCKKAGIPVADMRALIEEEAKQVGRDRRRGLWPVFDEILDRLGREE